MFQWMRPFVVLFALFAALANGTFGALASNAARHCDEMVGMTTVDMDDCRKGMTGENADPMDCAALNCGLTQTILPPAGIIVSSTIVTFSPRLRPGDELEPRGLSGSPDLRPPIA
jgi:hypothetical protein